MNGESDFSQKKLYPVFESESNKQTKTTEKKTEEQATDKPTCPHCNSENVYGISRIVGYFSRFDSWQPTKKKELEARRRGNYFVK